MRLQIPGHLKTMKCASTLSALTRAKPLRAQCAHTAVAQCTFADEEGDDDQEAVLPADMDARVKELCAALAEAERGGHAFIALKWFRDSFLPRKAFRWNQHPEMRQMVLAEAIQRGVVMTSKIANPKTPAYPDDDHPPEPRRSGDSGRGTAVSSSGRAGGTARRDHR